jgi:hypothetical protein
MVYDPLDPQADPFHPPAIPTQVECLHCGKEYESYLIEWRVETGPDGKQQGFWCCPTPGCDGCGFGFDILPTDPHYQDERGGWGSDDEEEDEEGEFDEGEFDEDQFGQREFDVDQLDDESAGNGDLPNGPPDDATDEDAGDGREDELPW